MFSRPKKPFLLIYMDIEDNISYVWCETEKEITAIMNEIINENCVIIDAIEINSCRELSRPTKYTDGDFLEEVLSAYDTAVKQGFDSIVIAIDTDSDITYYINDTEYGFQCDVFDYYFDDLDSLALELYSEKIMCKPTEIRIE